jgi:hypothetical protein
MPLDTANLVKWFQERPFWIQEATRLLLAKENLAEEDFVQLARICRQQAENPGTKQNITALTESAFAKKSASMSLRLNGLSEIKGIDALNPCMPLTFNEEPITTVYGGKHGENIELTS